MGVTKTLGAGLLLAAVALLVTKNSDVLSHASTATTESASSGRGSVADIPAAYVSDYKDAAGTCPNLDWALLAGIGKVETNHGQSRSAGVHSGSNSAGAEGPMQFLSSTFESVRSRHSDVGDDIYSPDDAIPAAAHYLCDSGLSSGNEYGAIFAYNHAGWYVAQVRAQAARYRAA